MAINVNPFDSRGLGAVAGNVMPNYSLENHGIKGGEFFKELALQNNASRGMDIQQTQVDNNAANDAARTAIMQQQADQQGVESNAQIAIAKQRAQHDQIRAEVEAMKSEKTEKLQQTMGTAASIVSGINSAYADDTLSPAAKEEEATRIKNETLAVAYSEGAITKDEYENGLKASPKQVSQVAQSKFLKAKYAIEGQKADSKDIGLVNGAPASASAEKDVTPTAAMKEANAVEQLTRQINDQQAQGLPVDQTLIDKRDALAEAVRARGAPGNIQVMADKAEMKAQGTRLTALNEKEDSYPSYVNALATTRQALAKTPGVLQGPFQGFTGLYKFSPEAQVLEGQLNRLTLAEKNAQKMGSQGYTDKDAEIVKSINGSMSNFKGSNEQLLNFAENIAKGDKVARWLQFRDIKQNGSGYDNWLANHPEPRVKMEDPNTGKQMYVPASKIAELNKKGAKTVGYDF